MNTFYKNKKVVVTGGAGFIGSHLTHHLVALGARVIVLDNLVTGKQENLSAIANAITFVNGNIYDASACDAFMQDCFAVFHCAAQVSVPESFANPQLCHRTNVTGTYNLLQAAANHGVQRFIFSSTCAVYGDHSAPCCETTPTNPLSPYAYSKLLGEQLCQQFSKLHNLPTVCLRYFNVFGPRQDPHGQYAGVIAKFTQALTDNMPAIIFGDGQQTRDFVPVDLVVEANLKLAMLPAFLCTGSPINIATEQSTSLIALFDKLKKGYPNYKHSITFAPARTGDIVHSQANCSRFKQLLGYLEQ